MKKSRGRPKKENNQLNSEIILACAKKLFVEEKKVPSIRQISSTLEVDAMSIYYYFPNKNSLLEAVAISLIKEIFIPKKSNLWQKNLELLCKSYLKLLQNYPGLLEIMLAMDSSGPANIFTKFLEEILKPLNLNNENFYSALSLLADYLHGFALAMQCNKNSTLDIEEINKPLKLYIKAIESCIESK